MEIEVQIDAPPATAADRARELAACGVDGLFTFEGSHDVFLPLAAAAPVVGTRLMTNVAVALPRSPLHLAHAAHDLQALSGGRFALGLGSQVRGHIEHRYGVTWGRPAARMGESVAATREILAAWQDRRSPEFVGEFTRHTLMPPMFSPEPLPAGPPPVMLGALGPVMTRTAGEVADGLLVMPFNTARHIGERTLPALHEGLRRAGRDLSEVAVVPQVVVGLGEDEDTLDRATRGVRGLLAFYGSTPAYRPVLEVHGWGEAQPELHRLQRAGDTAGMAAVIDDEMLDTLAVRGTAEECAATIRERYGWLADRVCAYFPGQDPVPALLGALADRLHEG